MCCGTWKLTKRSGPPASSPFKLTTIEYGKLASLSGIVSRLSVYVP